MKRFPYYKQQDQMDCGPTCLRMIAKYYNRSFSIQHLRELSGVNRDGVSLFGISEAAEKIGFRTIGMSLTISMLNDIDLPCILHWKTNHFVVLYKIQHKTNSKNTIYHVADPAHGLLEYTLEQFLLEWTNKKSDGQSEGLALSISPGPEFYNDESDPEKSIDLTYLFRYLFRYKSLLFQLILGLGVGSILQLIMPFLTQSIVDIGINTRNIHFIYVILIAQIMILIGRLSVDSIRAWILLHISTRINLYILTDFLIKMMKLPMSYFETKMTGDILQRMNDQNRIQTFLTGTSLTTIFTLFNLIVFAGVLGAYNITIFYIFLMSTVLYSFWVVFFLKKRRALDVKRFTISAENQSAVVQLISGIQEIKLNNCENQKRWEWERIQARLFKYNIKSLALGQYQQVGAFFIIEGKNILITFLVAKQVIEGNLSLGAMVAIQYIVGQLNNPIEQFVTFLQQYQDAKISLERLNEIHDMDDEEPAKRQFIHTLPFTKSISFSNISFTYPGAGNDPVLQDLALDFPEGKTTAIVGMSGSGKTTILKLLLRFYEPEKGDIKVGATSLNQIGYRYWRGKCGVVMQDGFIFSDTIARNIAVGDEYPNMDKLSNALHVANIHEFIEDLPLGLNTKIGAQGNGISQGQRQRILIARAVYKDPEYIFFDEATNSLDSNNESIIMENLESFFKGRTVIVVAHRLSTVRNADNIIVLKKGKIMESGNHQELIDHRGEYYSLVKNQLEIDA